MIKPPPPGYYDEFKARMIKKHWASFYWGWFYILFPLFWFFMVASPKWRPVRFDAKRRLVYFWSWGQLYIMHYPKSVQRDREQLLSFLSPEFFTPWIRPKHFGSLVFNIPHENPNKKSARRVPLGIYRPACEYQNHALLNFILDYLGSENPDEEYGKFFKKKNASPVTTSTGSINLASSHKSATTKRKLKQEFKHGWIKTIKNTKKSHRTLKIKNESAVVFENVL